MDVNHPDGVFVYYRKSCLNCQRAHCSSKTGSICFYGSLIVLHKVTPDIYQPAPTSPCWCQKLVIQHSGLNVKSLLEYYHMWHTINATARNKQPLFESGRDPAPAAGSPIVSLLLAGLCPHSDSLSIRAPRQKPRQAGQVTRCYLSRVPL